MRHTYYHIIICRHDKKGGFDGRIKGYRQHRIITTKLNLYNKIISSFVLYRNRSYIFQGNLKHAE